MAGASVTRRNRRRGSVSPSKGAVVLDARNGASRSAFRRGVVPSDRMAKRLVDIAKFVTYDQQQQQLDRKRKNIRNNRIGATLGAAGVAAGALAIAPRVPGKIKHIAGRAAVGSGVLGGGVGAHTAFQSANIASRDVHTQQTELNRRRAMAKGMPDQSALSVPAGTLKAKTYRASAMRMTQTGRLVRVKAGMG